MSAETLISQLVAQRAELFNSYEIAEKQNDHFAQDKIASKIIHISDTIISLPTTNAADTIIQLKEVARLLNSFDDVTSLPASIKMQFRHSAEVINNHINVNAELFEDFQSEIDGISLEVQTLKKGIFQGDD